MKRIVDLLFRDLLTREFSELLDSWALIFAIVPFGALIFCGMWIGQFKLDSTMLGIVLMFVFPLIGFALLYAVRKSMADSRRGTRPARSASPAEASVKADVALVVVRIEPSSETGHRTMYTLRRTDALENTYVQKGYAASVADLKAQLADTYTGVDWNHQVADPPKSLAAAMQRKEAQPGDPMPTSPR
jgi:hypothetical protein